MENKKPYSTSEPVRYDVEYLREYYHNLVFTEEGSILRDKMRAERAKAVKETNGGVVDAVVDRGGTMEKQLSMTTEEVFRQIKSKKIDLETFSKWIRKVVKDAVNEERHELGY